MLYEVITDVNEVGEDLPHDDREDAADERDGEDETHYAPPLMAWPFPAKTTGTCVSYRHGEP